MTLLRMLLDGAARLTAVVASLCIVAMMIHVALEVVCRAFLDMPLSGTIIFVANWYMVFLVCLPLAFVERLDGHIAVEVLTETFPPGLRRHLYGCTYPATAVIFAVTAYATWLEAVSKWRLGTFIIEDGLTIPIWFGYFALPIGYGLLSAMLLLKFAAYVAGEPLPPLAVDAEDDWPDGTTGGAIHD
ncbi:TRAP transporter small permease [Albimonas sp. CAU 1670]|uniref:TRAP transporter small permease n=1 Tax=Albimonas sp. CAU 1670 TaxID=3032599 RepID=UPI0023DAC6F9|nr:TRAP transporter small permease [Albimonas sp. CAU 1670]MDF2235669.1 TRAP transporter small permease [Albimonas sp. CAU 1670]